jgi:hypothetical protein
MKCSKPRVAFRPLVENLEGRLQPGSLIMGQGYGWSLLADHLSILNPDSRDSQSLVSPSSSEGSRPAPTSTAMDVRSDRLNIAITTVVLARSEPASLPIRNLIDNLVAGWPNDDLSNLSLSGQAHSVPLAAVAAPTVQQPAPVLVAAGSVPQSPIGVAVPAQPAAPTVVSVSAVASPIPLVSGAGPHAAPLQTITLDGETVDTVADYQTTSALHAVPIPVAIALPAPGGSAGNQATVNFLSYLGD